MKHGSFSKAGNFINLHRRREPEGRQWRQLDASQKKWRTMDKFHHFGSRISEEDLPELFTNPFHYTPHRLCMEAADEVRRYLDGKAEWHDELQEGKMIGVLVARDKGGDIGFLAAFSGNLAGSNNHGYFVPPVYDLLNPSGYFHAEEAEISAINHRIEELLACEDYSQKRQSLEKAKAAAEEAIETHRRRMMESKARRNAARESGCVDDAELIRESQWQKAEMKRIKAHWSSVIADAETEVKSITDAVDALKSERKRRSADLQHWLFRQFVVLNARGERRDLCEIFAGTPQKEPPSGAGECAAPKLLQYAYENGFTPIAMAEFWYGKSPKGVVRHDGEFYPACRGKCLPILSFMLQGLRVESPLGRKSEKRQIRVLYEDDSIVAVDKPAGMLSVPGKIPSESLTDLMRQRCPDASGLMPVHRLDMDTSGIVIFAKSLEVYKDLQKQFASHAIRKEYEALLCGIVPADIPKEGRIELPIGPDYENRPMQMVREEFGKRAVTEYKIIGTGKIGVGDGQIDVTRIVLHPITGRTHQLRVHCAHPQGLGVPILGDPIYGRRNNTKYHGRMCLHAKKIEFTHPVNGEEISIETQVEFCAEK